uniref:ANK_REP_REGION domain-containing protein n=1 Tax=Macrostomum lignano TaxID=282301 RepID=A0A1I8HLS6_9PLAT
PIRCEQPPQSNKICCSAGCKAADNILRQQLRSPRFAMSSSSDDSEFILQELTQPDPRHRTRVGDSPADLQTLAHDAIRGDFGQVRRLATRQLVTSADAARRTVLMLVADAPETPVHTEKCILYLFELGANSKAADANGDTAAHLAARRDHLRLLTLLSFDAKWLRNDNGATPLMEAARTGSWKCAKHLLHLLRQAMFNECRQHGNSKRSRLLGLKNREGRTASDLARLSGHSELASYIEREMRLVVGKNGYISGLTAQEEADRKELQRLAEAGDSARLRRAATRGRCDLPDNWGFTALMYAARNSSCRDEALWKQLVQLGDPTCANIWACSCLHHAARAGNSAAASALLAAGASANARNQWESTALSWAAIHAPPATAAAVGRVLLDSGVDWSLEDGRGRTALDFAKKEGRKELAELLRGYDGKIYFDKPLALARNVFTDHALDNEPSDDEPDRLKGNFYPVTDPQGYCLIINISKYDTGSHITFEHTERQGSVLDVERVQKVFESLRFIVKIREDLTAEQVDNFLCEIKKSPDLAKHGSFVCFLMAHGTHDCIYGRDGVPCEIRKLTDRFLTSVCSGLQGKPKVFFVQACRGSRRDRTDAPNSREETDEAPAPVLNDKVLPAESDFLVCFANTPGSAAFRNIEKGSVYVQTVCDFIEDNFRELDLGDIMTEVSGHLQRNPVRVKNKLHHVVPQKVDQLSRKELTQLDPSNRTRVGDSPADLQTLAQLVSRGDFGQVRRLATRQLVTSADAARRTVLMLVADAPETPLGANPKAADANGDTAAHLAARRDHLRLLTLLSFDAKWLRDDNGATPLMEAARTGSWKCAKHLLHLLRQAMFNKCRQHGNLKRSRLLGLKNREGRKASDLARLSGHLELASYIKRRRGSNRNCSGWPMRATRRGCGELWQTETVTCLTHFGATAMMWAAGKSSCRDEALWEQLVQLGDPTCANVLAGSCLHHAARTGDSVAASALLAAGASTNARDYFDAPHGGRLRYASRHRCRSRSGSAGLGADWSLKDGRGRTALDLATEEGNSELAELLCGQVPPLQLQELTQPDPSNRTSVGDSPADLHTLAQLVSRGDFGKVRRLATRQLVTSADADRRTVLMLVADAPETPVHTEKCILYLFEKGVNLKAADANGDTAAHLAARRDHLRLLTLLSFDAKWLRNDNGATPLMEAARTGSWKCAKHLLHLLRQRRFNESTIYEDSKRSELLKLCDRNLHSASDLARRNGHLELTSYIEREMRLVVDRHSFISGLIAKEKSDRQELRRLADKGLMAALRRAATRSSCDLPDQYGCTALMWAAQNRSCCDEILWEQLVHMGDPTLADFYDKSCLHHAASAGNSAAASALLAVGVSANATSGMESTPLMQAAIHAPPATAAAVGRVLLDSGADWSLKDINGETALDLATEKGKSELAELLRGVEGDFYPVTDPQGYCLIINISKYDSGSDITFSHTERKGSVRDVERVKQVFESLRFIVKVKEDLTAEQVDDFLHEIKKSPDLGEHGSFVCFLMAHGSHDCIYGRDGCPYEIRKLTDRFQSSVCRRLEGRPKAFFIQACRGSRLDRAVVAPNSREETDEAPAPVYNTAVRPAESDFLLCYANTPGSAAFRNIDTGSLYVQTVCDFIEKNFRELDLSTIMTKVSGHLQENPVRVKNNLYHVVPQKVDQLSRLKTVVPCVPDDIEVAFMSQGADGPATELSCCQQFDFLGGLRVAFFQAVIETVLLYNAETWTLMELRKQQVDAAHADLLSAAFRIGNERVTNAAFYHHDGLVRPSDLLRRRRLQLAFHIIRAERGAANDAAGTLPELTQPDPSNRASVGDSPADLQTLAHDVIRGDFGQVRRLATRQLVTSADANRRTVLMLVADAPETPVHTEKCILYLFKLGANPKAADANGDTAAHLAARRDHLRLLTLLWFDAKWLRNDNGATPLMEAARTGSWKCAKHLLHLLRQLKFNECLQHGNSKRSRLLGLQNCEGRTASDLARLSGYSELASYIEREMRLVVEKYAYISGLTAQEKVDRKEMKRLAEAGDWAGLRRAATRSSCDLPDRCGVTALMCAARNSSCSNEALWEQLVQLGDPTCVDSRSDSCLHWAGFGGNSAAASALLAAGASANARTDRGYCELTPLMLAAIIAPPATAAAVGRVLLDSGADWSLKDRDDRTALDLATQTENSELAELLRGYEDKKFFDEPLKPL